MNRREALQAGLSVLAAVKIDGEAATISTKNPQAFVITAAYPISQETRNQLRDSWDRIFRGTELEGVPVICLDCGKTLQVIDKVDS